MNDIEQKALALINEVAIEECEEVNLAPHKSLCAALRLSVIEHEATKQEFSDFRQKVSDAVLAYSNAYSSDEAAWATLKAFIIPKPKPDPLVEVIAGWTGGTVLLASDLRAALDAAGFEIREKNDG